MADDRLGGNPGIQALNRMINKSVERSAGIGIAGQAGIDLANDRPWDRLDAESDRAWEAFRLFRDMGVGRSIQAVWKDFGHSDDSTVRGWAQKYFWRARSQGWDKHLDKIAQKAYEEEAATMGRRHARLGMRLQEVGSERLEEIIETPELKAQITPREALEITKAGVSIEREARAVEKGTGSQGAGTIIFNLNMPSPPKWAPKQIRDMIQAEVVETNAPTNADVAENESGK